MENSEKPIIEIVSVTNLNFIDRLYESFVGQLNKGEYFISNESNTSITLKNKNFTKQLLMNLGMYLALIIFMVVIGFGLAMIGNEELYNTTIPILGLSVILLIYYMLKAVWTLNYKVNYRKKKIFTTNFAGLRKVLITSDQKFLMIQQSGISFFNEINESDVEGDDLNDNSVDATGDNQSKELNDRKNWNVISFRNQQKQIESINLFILYDPEKQPARNFALNIVSFIQANYPGCEYITELSANDN